MTEQNPITPPPELMEQWMQSHSTKYDLAREAAQWGADQELEACCNWLPKVPPWSGNDLRKHRRPKPDTSLVERVQNAIGHSYPDDARVAIREVNAWLRERAGGTRASWLLDNEVEQ
jgi:hypothetical protein